MKLERFISRIALACGLLVLLMFAAGFFGTPARAAHSYRFKVVSITGMTELKTQSNSDAGRLATLEKTINQHVSEGWEFVQADGYVLYFRR